MTLKQTVNQHRQNKPSRLAREMSKYMDYNTAMEMLLRHGVFKWMSARRDLIKLKNTWGRRLPTARGRRCAQLVECREAVRKICHSSRLRAPDHDSKAEQWLRGRLQEDR